MKVETNFMLTKATCMVYPTFNEVGKLQSMVMENKELIQVDFKPTDLLDQNIRYHGSSLRGAWEGSRVILGGRFAMIPVIVSEKLNMYWFPLYSPSRPDCAWFALQRIHSYHRLNKKQTRVLFDNGEYFIADISYTNFDGKYVRACRLKHAMDRRTESLMVCESPQSATYLISRDTSDRNYSVEMD